ncbi:MAG: 16S rRNA (adenine(1518)-N(6)/adenine(1519)-N(6))-dimethyltransferase RsmA [Bacteroidota bacterium]
MKPKKSFGQHFLKNEAIAERIAMSISETSNDLPMLEVGPGKGMLTKYLLEKGLPLTVVEADHDMVEFLKENFHQLHGNIISGDVLREPLEAYFDGNFVVIGNFPYNISSQILFKVLDHKDQVVEVVGMFQKEMAERVAAAPGNKIYGVISVLIQAWYEVEYLFGVSPGNFHPPPKVQSAVIRLKRRKIEDNPDCDMDLFRKIVKVTFGQRRKMLRNTLKSFVNDPEWLAHPSLTKRPEQLSVAQFVELTNKVNERLKC